MTSNDFAYIKPLYAICTCLGVAPPHAFEEDTEPVSILYKSYTVLQIFLVTFIFIHSWYGRALNLYNTDASDVTIDFTDKLANIALYIFTAFTLISNIFLQGKKLKLFLNKALKLSKLVKIHCMTRRYFNFQLTLFNLYLFVLIFFDGYVWMTSVGWKLYQFYIGRTYQYYLYNLVLFSTLHLVLMIRSLFKSLRDTTEAILVTLICSEDTNLRFIIDEFKSRSRPASQHSTQELRTVRIYYNEICDLIDLFNSLFGLLILLAILVIISMILNQIDIFLVYSSEEVAKNLTGVAYGTELAVLVILWIVTFMSLAVFLAYACSEATSERDKLSVRCYYWLNQLPSVPKSDYQINLKEELCLLVQQCTTRQPKFSAFGFFLVDFTLFGFIIGNITSYVIVMIQFIK